MTYMFRTTRGARVHILKLHPTSAERRELQKRTTQKYKSVTLMRGER